MDPREYDSLFAAEERHWWFVELRREISGALARDARDRSRWLDAGCGTGGLLALLPEPRPSARFGLDRSFRGLVLARRRGLARLVCASADRLPFRDGSFDLITSIDVLSHRDVRKSEAVSEASRCLAPGGILIVQVPAFDRLKSAHDDAVWTDRRFRLGEVRQLVEGAGLRVARAFYRNSFLFPAAAARRLLSRRRGSRDPRSDVRPALRSANALFGSVLRMEAALRRRGVSFPFGLSVFCVAEKGR